MLGWLEDIEQFIFDMFKGGTETFLNLITEIFQHSVDTVRQNVSETPTEFSQTIVDSLRTISDTAILPVAGIILTYLFCYELYNIVVEQNRGKDFETGRLFFLIFKTSVIITILTNSFTITLAVFDLGKWITDKIPDSTLVIPESINDTLLNSIEDGEIGVALSMWIVTAIALLASFVMAGVIYLVAWSRIITILLYISVSPIPFATFLTGNWVGSIGQSYVKNLLALMLQGYFMIVCLIIYAGLLEKTSELIVNESSPIYALLLMLVSMGILVMTLTKTHGLAKSVVGAN